jgi:hypothetical protein
MILPVLVSAYRASQPRSSEGDWDAGRPIGVSPLPKYQLMAWGSMTQSARFSGLTAARSGCLTR